MIEHETKARDAMASSGLHPKSIIIDGKFHRFSTSNKSTDTAGFYCFSNLDSCIVGVFGDWREDIKHSFCSKSESVMSNIERAQVQREIKAQQVKERAEKKKLRDEAALKAAEIMDSVNHNATHEYINKKQIEMLGGAGVTGNILCVPCYNKDMQLVNVERITMDSKKPLYGGERIGAFSMIGSPAEGETLLLAEGYATACSIHMATKKPVIVAFNAGNMPAVAAHFKHHPMIICADNDANEIGLKKAQEAQKKHGNATIKLCPVRSDFNDLHVAQGLQAVREAIYPKAVNTTKKINVVQRHDNWWDRWVYVNSHNRYYCLDDRQFYASEAFNLKCTSLVPADEKKTATSYVTANGLIDVIAQPTYAPNIKDLFFTESGRKCINTYNHENELKAADVITQEGEKAINAILHHIFCICNRNHEHYELMVNWLAWQVQRRGEKILWSPVIQGIDGIGKSFIGDVARNMLGNENVNIVKPTEIMGNYNGWATGACLVIVNEIKITGHNRYDVVNSLKPLITDPYIQISEKYIASYNVLNVSNYFCTTNHKDAIPITATDRRWWILYSEYECLADFLNVAKGGDDYFTKLYDGLHSHIAEVVKYFMDWKISEDFIKAKQAPQTTYKEDLLRNEDAKMAGLSEAREVLARGGAFFNEEIVCSGDFFKTLMEVVEDFELKSQNRAVFMQKLGYNMHKAMWIDGKARKVWVRKSGLSDEYIKDEMMKTTYHYG